jgi:hypothetical protein
VRLVTATLVGAALALALPGSAAAQLEQWINPTLGEQQPEADYRATRQ